MARRPVRSEADDADETPPWMERAPKPSRPAPPPAPATHTVISWRALIIGAVVLLVAAIGAVIVVRRMSTPVETTTADGQPPLIRAPTTPYKTRIAPDASAAPDAAALAANTDDPIATLASAPDPETPQRPATPAPRDLMPGGPIDATADAPADAAPLDEPPGIAAPAPHATAPKPVAAPGPPDPPAPRPKPKSRPKPVPAPDTSDEPPRRDEPAPPEATPAQPTRAKPAPTSATLQIGAFSTREKAEAAWTQALAAHPALARLHRSIAPLERDGRTLYRLRATGPTAPKLCATLPGAACIPK